MEKISFADFYNHTSLMKNALEGATSISGTDFNAPAVAREKSSQSFEIGMKLKIRMYSYPCEVVDIDNGVIICRFLNKKKSEICINACHLTRVDKQSNWYYEEANG